MKNFKNGISKRKLELTAVFLAFAVIALLKIVSAFNSPVSAEEIVGMPSLFYNDRPFVYSVPGNETYLPLQSSNGVFYVPLELIKQLNDIKMDSKDNYTDNFYIQYKNNYISFQISKAKASGKNAEYMNCKVYRYMGITYVPVEIIAKELELDWEYRDEYGAGRIKEAGAARTFDELLEKFIPKPRPAETLPPETAETETYPPEHPPHPTSPNFPPLAQTEPPAGYTEAPLSEPASPPVTQNDQYDQYTSSKTPETSAKITTEKPSDPEPAVPENTREIQNYLIFCDNFPPENENDGNISKALKIEEILSELDKNGKMKAVFFFSGEEILKNPEIVRSIYASGHSLGIKFDRNKTDDLPEKFEEANALIYFLTKHKTKFCISGDQKDSKTQKYIYENSAVPNGYYLCGHTADIYDLADIKNPDEMTEFIKAKRYNVFMFDIGDDCKKYIEWFGAAAKSKFYIHFSYMTNANINMIKMLTNR